MKSPIQPLKIITALLFAIAASIGLTPAQVGAETLPRSIINSLAYPTSSQRFFEEGYAQMEREIQQLQGRLETNTPVLNVQPAVREQPEELQRLEPQLEEIIPEQFSPTNTQGSERHLLLH
ncbi:MULTISPECIES: hypothetical protein [unclassified Leptolyngbya]|uniref:hypothetical protein n=1 Tax=unclassified Leptolyngbya TaxID=2650499 RepID=UPI001688527E|nr:MULTISPECIES: hypothetical protein [unclassified Leptolyngbya]MBD1911605.1 hypothetical protein [Leptolyngbya sp. FACHB-8]MBD2155222.1 hypothetical protein [Leptolyngbya sp. FACHB-16]